ncbi:MAG: hypothetical protein IJO46_10990 [Thermoguttaceae bacterium]|nr:hypothetical protein [Thermoguttaceae bacterium]
MAVVYFTSNASTGAGSLVEAVKNAQPGDVVRPDEAVFERGSTIEIAIASTLTIDKNLTLDASPFRVRLDGGGAVRCANIATGVNVKFTSLDFIGGVASPNGENGDESGNGGGLRVERGANVVLSRCRVCGCDAARSGGGIYVGDAATLTANDSAIFGNRAQFGGGVYVGDDAAATLSGATVCGNVDANAGLDTDGETSTSALSAVNSILGNAFDNSETSGSVVDVASSSVGFVAPPPDGLTFESWSRNAWQNWDLRLLDDASPNPSPYRDAGDVDNMSRYDVQGNFRGRETGGAASCSPGAYETLQADLFWVGVDASGAPVASPTLLSADGWATSRFASASGDTAPQLGQTLFVDGVVSFSDVLSTTSTQTFGLTLGGGAVVTFEPIQIVYCSTFTLGAGSTFGGLRGRLIGPRQRLRFGANARIDTTTLRISINDVWFDAGGYVAACECYAFAPPEPRYGALTILRATDATPRLNGAYFCESFRTARSGDSASYSIPTAPGASIRCRSFEYKLDFAEGRLFTNAVVVELYGDATATVSRTGTTTLDVAADFAVDATDATSATLTLDGQTVYGDASNAAVELTGSAKIDERGLDVASLTLADGALSIDGGSVNVGTLSVAGGATVAFSGSDATLAATETATVGAASFTGTGYFATPPGTNLTAATFAEAVRVCDYGALLASFLAAPGVSGVALAWTVANADASVLLERQDANGWAVVETRAVGGSARVDGLEPGTTLFRAFDGAQFLTAQTLVQASHIRLDYDDSSVVALAPVYEVVLEIVLMSDYRNRGESPLLLARVADSATGDFIPKDAVASIVYSARRVETLYGSKRYVDVEGHVDREIPLDAYFDLPVADDPRWLASYPNDERGYNFRFEPDSTRFPVLPEPGDYEIVVEIRFRQGNPAPLVFRTRVV